MDLSVMTFNLRFNNPRDEGNSWEHRKDAAAEIFARYKPTVAGTQEGLYGMLADLGHRLSEYEWVGEGRNGGRENEFNAIFYRKDEVEAVDWGQFWLSELPDGPMEKSWGTTHFRICTWALFRFRAEPGPCFLHYNTHLDHSSQQAREKGSRLLSERLAEHRRRTGLPAILTGDMNAEPDNPAIAFLSGKLEVDGVRCALHDAYEAAGEEPGRSFHGFAGGDEGQPIDYVFASPEVRIEGVRIIRDRMDNLYPSDHYPVLAKAKIPVQPAVTV
ncbi:endonuclease/exonuclease/phosphatase family protein [Paenibacillus mesophilus]|uniref:endonuclease/exonuclease/phosphatase family protein n=1 Tax=Paenibacillus mesophilus TaxID=2582849 RepID=UPI00110D7F36|nr:endonuclease/exonuclease/phosphatase family protein [Paenibacillus mesophilus]TMV48993.1 endonuclease/exonuclease/phosphatase family protein [Paenibacillus mesophilus]